MTLARQVVVLLQLLESPANAPRATNGRPPLPSLRPATWQRPGRCCEVQAQGSPGPCQPSAWQSCANRACGTQPPHSRPRCPRPCGGWFQRARLSARVPGDGRPGHALCRTRGVVQGKAWRQYSGAVGSGRGRLQQGKGTACCCRVMTRNLMEGESRSWKSACGRHPAPHALQGKGELWAAGEQSKDPRAAHLTQDERDAPESWLSQIRKVPRLLPVYKVGRGVSEFVQHGKISR